MGPINNQSQPLISPKGKVSNQMGGPGPGLAMNQVKNPPLINQMDPQVMKMNQGGGGMMPPHMSVGNQGQQQMYGYQQQQSQLQQHQSMSQNNYGPNSGYMGGHMGSNMYGGVGGPGAGGGGAMIPPQQQGRDIELLSTKYLKLNINIVNMIPGNNMNPNNQGVPSAKPYGQSVPIEMLKQVKPPVNMGSQPIPQRPGNYSGGVNYESKRNLLFCFYLHIKKLLKINTLSGS